jgi:hypothetical protein
MGNGEHVEGEHIGSPLLRAFSRYVLFIDIVALPGKDVVCVVCAFPVRETISIENRWFAPAIARRALIRY